MLAWGWPFATTQHLAFLPRIILLSHSTANQWFRQGGQGFEVIQHCKELEVECEIWFCKCIEPVDLSLNRPLPIGNMFKTQFVLTFTRSHMLAIAWYDWGCWRARVVGRWKQRICWGCWWGGQGTQSVERAYSRDGSFVRRARWRMCTMRRYFNDVQGQTELVVLRISCPRGHIWLVLARLWCTGWLPTAGFE